MTSGIANMLAGGVLLLSFAMLYQNRLPGLLQVLAAQSATLAIAIAWQASQHTPHLFIIAAITLILKAVAIPLALRHIVTRLHIHLDIETTGGIGLTMLAGIALSALSLAVMLPVTSQTDPALGQDLALALATVLIGLLIMVTRRNAVSQVVGFLSVENGIDLAASGAHGMPMVVELSVAASILVGIIVIGIYLFRIRERFDTVDLAVLDRFRGERQ